MCAGSFPNANVQMHRMITQLQTQMSVISMHCGEINKLCSEHADPRRVEMKCRSLKDEEKEVCQLLKDLVLLKEKLRYSDQMQLDGRLRALSEEYNSILGQFRRACALASDYAHQMQAMNTSQLRRAEGAPPRAIALGEGLGTAMLVEDTVADDTRREEEQLEQDVGQLSEMFASLLEHTADQGRRIETLEAHMEAAAAEAHAGAVELTKAAKLSAAAVPIAGAVVGGVLLGPVGMLAGLKGAGAITATIGAGAGYLTGFLYKRRVQAAADAARDELDTKTK